MTDEIDHHGRVVFDRGTPERFRSLVRDTLNESDFIDAIGEGETIAVYGYDE